MNCHDHERDQTISRFSPNQVSETVLYACGFNAHGQLDETSNDDIFQPRKLIHSAVGTNTEVLFAGWSETVLHSEAGIIRSGWNTAIWEQLSVKGDTQPSFTQAFGDHNGLLGALDTEGRVYLTSPRSKHPTLLPNPAGLSISAAALAGNDRFAICLHISANTPSAQVVEFHSLDDFKRWYHDISEMREKCCIHHDIPGRVKQLTANSTTFACLTDGGEVYTWGDARHRSLGRGTTSEDGSRADRAGLVDALGGIKIVKISSGGWMHAALSEEGAAYLWGSGAPGKEDSIGSLEGLDSSEVGLVEINDNMGEPMDVLDVAVGAGHAVLLTQNGVVYSVGDNVNGQLGIGKGTLFARDWTKVDLSEDVKIVAVHAGPKSTMIKVELPGGQEC